MAVAALCPTVEEVENEEGSLGLTLLCPAVEEELTGEDPRKVRMGWLADGVAIPSSAVETAMVRRRKIGASILDLYTDWLAALQLVLQHQQILLIIHWILNWNPL